MSTDWLKIISAHVAWKQRLEELLRGTSAERLEPDVIALDNRCDLGKWIYGSGASFSATPDYGVVKDLHAQFHRAAASVVSCYQNGDTQAARELLDGEYSHISDSLKRHILKLRGQVT